MALIWRWMLISCVHAVIFALFQVMKPTRTSSETSHTWPQTTPRSSNAAVLTPKLSQLLPPLHPAQRSTLQPCILPNTRIENMQVSNSQACRHSHFPLATCHMFSHSSAGVDFRGDERPKQWILCVNTSDQNNCAQVGSAGTALWEQH